MLSRARAFVVWGAIPAVLLAATLPAAANPAEVEATRVCGSTTWRHGVADLQHLRGIACARAKTVVRYALNHGAARRVAPRDFLTSRRRFMGFRFVFQRGTYDTLIARDGRANVTFALCWWGVDC